MKEHLKDLNSEKGQVIVLYAIFILFLVVVGLSVVDLGKVVMFKTEVRQFTDRSTVAAESVEKETVPLIMNVKNTPDYGKLIYSTGIMLQNYNEAAAMVHQYDPTYNQLAIWFFNHGYTYVDDYKTLADSFVTFPSGINYEDSSFLTMDPGIYSNQDRLVKGMFSFTQLEKMIVYRDLMNKNIETSTQGWQNQQTIFIPTPYLLKRTIIENIDLDSFDICCQEVDGITINTTSFYNGSFTEELTSGMLCYQIVNIPDLLLSDAVVTNNGKLGKQLMVTYSGLNLPQGIRLPDAWIDEYNEKLHEKNLTAIQIIEDMNNYIDPSAGNGWELRKTYVKNKWDELELLYQGMFAELEAIDSLEMESPHEFYETATPKISSLNSLRWDEDPSYVAIAASMGYDLSVNGEKESFYNNVTLEDLFSDEDNFFLLIDDSVDNMDTCLNDFFTDYPGFVTSISKYGPDDINHENSFSSTLYDIVVDATNHATLSSENTKMVQYLDRLSSTILEQHQDSQAYQVLISHRNGFDYSELKPNPELKVYLNKFFGKSITKWETN